MAFFMNLALNLKRDIQACHRIKNNRTIIKLNNRKDCLQVLRAKKRLKDLDGTTLNLPSGSKIFINESLCGYYRGLWNKCKRLKGDEKIDRFYTSNNSFKTGRKWFSENHYPC